MTVARPTRNNIVGAGIGREHVGRTTCIVGDEDLASFGRAEIKSDRTAVIRPTRRSGHAGEKSELGGIGTIIVGRPNLVIARLSGLKGNLLSVGGKVRKCDGAL